MAHRLFLWFYCLSIPQALGLCAAVSAAVLAAHRAWHRRLWWRLLLVAALAGGLFLIGWQTVLSRTPGDFRAPQLQLFASYAAVFAGGNREILRSNLMNVLLFFPLGFSAALLLPGKPAPRVLLLTGLLGLFSFGIEYAQLRWGLGLCEADDVLHNTLGALLGALTGAAGPGLWERLLRKL